MKSDLTPKIKLCSIAGLICLLAGTLITAVADDNPGKSPGAKFIKTVVSA